MKTATLGIMGRPKKAEPTESLRVPQSLAREIRHLAVDARMDVSDYFAREFGAMIRQKADKMRERQTKASRDSLKQ